jgi:hypothetical protein
MFYDVTTYSSADIINAGLVTSTGNQLSLPARGWPQPKYRQCRVVLTCRLQKIEDERRENRRQMKVIKFFKGALLTYIS